MHDNSLPRRSWTSDERDQVIRGFTGRLFIAIEPLLCSITFTIFTFLPFSIKIHEITLGPLPPRFTLAQILAPIFGFGAVGFGIYTVWVMLRPTRAIFSTFSPIYIVDGYLRYQTRSTAVGRRHTAVAILSHNQETIQEWVTPHLLPIADGLYPAMVEFSRYGGILRIDGRPVDPPLFPLAPFGIGTFTSIKNNSKRLH